MAIYHFSVKAISRGAGRSAVACAAYRSGEKLQDDRYGKEQDYTKKSGVEFTNIYAPENTNPELLDRQTLWNSGILHRQFLGCSFFIFDMIFCGILHRQFLGCDHKLIQTYSGGILHRQFLGIRSII